MDEDFFPFFFSVVVGERSTLLAFDRRLVEEVLGALLLFSRRGLITSVSKTTAFDVTPLAVASLVVLGTFRLGVCFSFFVNLVDILSSAEDVRVVVVAFVAISVAVVSHRIEGELIVPALFTLLLFLENGIEVELQSIATSAAA